MNRGPMKKPTKRDLYETIEALEDAIQIWREMLDGVPVGTPAFKATQEMDEFIESLATDTRKLPPVKP